MTDEYSPPPQSNFEEALERAWAPFNGSALLANVDWDGLENHLAMVRAGLEHADPAVRARWRVIVTNELVPAELNLLGGVKDPRERRGNKKGNSKYLPGDMRLAQEEERSFLAGEKTRHEAIEILLDKMGVTRTRNAKMKRRRAARIALGLTS